ncbi:MAG: hypothetical protein AAGI69_00545 [Cyanobacteria bacterium P01_H01_bin.21]
MAWLIIPFVLREINSNFEPFPAVLQPSGASKVSTESGLIRFSKKELFVVKNDDSVEKIDPDLFFEGIPNHFWSHIVENSFGLGEKRAKSFSIGIWEITAATQLEASKAEKNATLSWINSRLSEMGLEDVEGLRFQKTSSVFDINKKERVEYDVVEQIDIEINE